MKLVPIPDEIDVKILQHLMEGCGNKEISGKVWKSISSVEMRLYRLRKYYGVKTNIQLVCLLNKELWETNS